MDQGLIFNIQRFSIHDGPGIRVSIFLKGCPLSCWWCHNPESQSSEIVILDKKLNFGGKEISDKEIVGKLINDEDLLAEIEKERIFFEDSGGGVTFTGGEPILHHEFLLRMINLCKDKKIHVTIDTSGYASEKIFINIAEKVDLFLFDLKIIDNTEHIKYCGVPVEPILRNLKYLDKIKKETIIRFPVIPTITDKNQNIEDIINFLKRFININKIELLPYHRIAEGKYKKFNITYNMKGIQPPSEDKILELKNQFTRNGFIIINP